VGLFEAVDGQPVGLIESRGVGDEAHVIGRGAGGFERLVDERVRLGAALRMPRMSGLRADQKDRTQIVGDPAEGTIPAGAPSFGGRAVRGCSPTPAVGRLSRRRIRPSEYRRR